MLENGFRAAALHIDHITIPFFNIIPAEHSVDFRKTGH